ncbi:MAG: hypothetical protein HFE75_07180 [Firmicutes bacterium]|nr:hypothetical protein [Bacillota bacterium]NBI61961.1 hypothetical protein [Clostridiales bacterium]
MEKTRFACGMEYLREIDGNGGETAFLCGFKSTFLEFSTALLEKEAGSNALFLCLVPPPQTKRRVHIQFFSI